MPHAISHPSWPTSALPASPASLALPPAEQEGRQDGARWPVARFFGQDRACPSGCGTACPGGITTNWAAANGYDPVHEVRTLTDALLAAFPRVELTCHSINTANNLSAPVQKAHLIDLQSLSWRSP
jgi:hypothetical protein